MLTKDDLAEIRKIVREEVDVEREDSESHFIAEIKLFRMRIEDQLSNLANRIKDLMIKVKNN